MRKCRVENSRRNALRSDIFFRFWPQPNVTKIDVLGLHSRLLFPFTYVFFSLFIRALFLFYMYAIYWVSACHAASTFTSTFTPLYNNIICSNIAVCIRSRLVTFFSLRNRTRRAAQLSVFGCVCACSSSMYTARAVTELKRRNFWQYIEASRK